MFWCWFKKLKVPRCWIVLLLNDFGQESTFNIQCIKTLKLSLPKKFQGKHLCYWQKLKPTSLNLITSIWLNFAPSWISYNVGIWGYQQHIFVTNLPHNNSKCCDRMTTMSYELLNKWSFLFYNFIPTYSDQPMQLLPSKKGNLVKSHLGLCCYHDKRNP
jgi:hypothetical protein